MISKQTLIELEKIFEQYKKSHDFFFVIMNKDKVDRKKSRAQILSTLHPKFIPFLLNELLDESDNLTLDSVKEIKFDDDE